MPSSVATSIHLLNTGCECDGFGLILSLVIQVVILSVLFNMDRTVALEPSVLAELWFLFASGTDTQTGGLALLIARLIARVFLSPLCLLYRRAIPAIEPGTQLLVILCAGQ